MSIPLSRLRRLSPSLFGKGDAPSGRAKPFRECPRMACSAAVGLFLVLSDAGGFQRGWVVI